MVGPVLAVLLAFAPAAHAAYDAKRLADLVRGGRHQAAYDYALNFRAEHEGELEFDLYYGISAANVGELSEAIFALERVVAREPGFDRARLELARAYFLREDDRRARREFETVLAHDPPQAVQAQIQRYLDAIGRRADRYRTTASGYVELALGHDSNVNAATDNETVDILGGLRVTLDETSQELADDFARIEVRGNVSHPISPGFNLVASGGLWQRSLAEESEFETGAFDASFGGMWRSDRSRITATGQVQRFYLDGEPYRDLAGIGGQYFRSFSDKLALDVSARVSALDYDDRPDLDSTLWIVDAGFSRSFPGARQLVFAAGLFAGAEEAEEDSAEAQANTERDLLGARARLWLALAPRWSARARLEFSRSEYADDNPLFAETREEDYYRLGLGADWRPSARWRVGPEVAYTQNEANIGLFDYERTEAWVRARYEFF